MAYSGALRVEKPNPRRTALEEVANPLLDVRRNNLRALREERGAESLAKALGLKNTSYLSQLIHRHRAITERTARTWEKRLGLRAGWFDQAHQEIGPSTVVDIDLLTKVNEVIDSLQIRGAITHRQRATIIATCMALKRSDPAYISMLVSLTQP